MVKNSHGQPQDRGWARRDRKVTASTFFHRRAEAL